MKRTVKRAKTIFDENYEGRTSELIFYDPKTKSGNRSIPLMKSAIAELKMHQVRQDKEKKTAGLIYSREKWVFCTELGELLEPRNFRTKTESSC